LHQFCEKLLHIIFKVHYGDTATEYIVSVAYHTYLQRVLTDKEMVYFAERQQRPENIRSNQYLMPICVSAENAMVPVVYLTYHSAAAAC